MRLLNIFYDWSGYSQWKKKRLVQQIIEIQAELTRELILARNGIDAIFFVILVPGCLHIAKRSLGLLPDSLKVILILNGVDRFEEEWINKNLKCFSMVKAAKMVSHDIIINALIDSGDQAFGIIDYDCFVFQDNYFEQIKSINNETAMLAYFAYNNTKLNLLVPETFFLYINAQIVNKLGRKYLVDAAPVRWQDLPIEVCEKLNSLGLSEQLLPESHKSYFDTLRVIMLLSLIEDVPYRFLAQLNCHERLFEDIIHIGGVSYPNLFANPWKFLGSYFWRRLLEAETDDTLKRYYYQLFGGVSSRELLENNQEVVNKVSEQELHTMNKIIDRVLKIPA